MWTKSTAESAKETSGLQFAQPIPPEVSPPVGGLIRAVGHDLRNKLGVMNNSIYYLSMRLGYRDKKVKKHLEILGSEITTANRIVTDLVEFALIDKPSLRKSDIKTIVAQALSQASLPDRWQAAVRLDDGLPSLMADGMQLQTAFTNIILMIVQGAPKGGRLQIIAGVRDGFMEVSFEATGFIVSEKHQASMDGSLVSAGGIRNLGMFVSKRLVESHEGTIKVSSLAGGGAILTVRLPLPSAGVAKRGQEGPHLGS